MSEPTCYALVYYHYDYFEWEETWRVSFDKEKLVKEYSTQFSSENPLAGTEVDHKAFAKIERAHWFIEPVKFLK